MLGEVTILQGSTAATASTITGGWDTSNQALLTTIPAVTADP